LLVSEDQPVFASDGVENPEVAVNGSYNRSSNATSFPTDSLPGWVAVQIEQGPTRLLLIWADPGWTDYDNVSSGAPAGYRVETSGDSTDGSDGTWEEVVSVTENPVRLRGHSFDFTGQSWVRFVVTEAQADVDESRIDEIAIYDISENGDDTPQDTWLFMGDSITKGAFERDVGGSAGFISLVNGSHPDTMPAVIGAGIGGETASDGANHIEEWLALNPDFMHVGIAYGTNDAWGNHDPEAVGFEDDLVAMIEAVLAADRVPILARIPYSPQSTHRTLPDFNAVIDRVRVEYELPCGPDFYTWFRDHPDDLGTDGIHPVSAGYSHMHQVWAEAVDHLYPEE
jgi:lysophospholipase L1-like esterase